MKTLEQALSKAMDYKVRSIEEFLGIPFEGETEAEKRRFIGKHWKERVEVADRMMQAAYKEQNKKRD